MYQFFLRLICVYFLLSVSSAFAVKRIQLAHGFITIPDSTLVKTSDAGIRMHTNYEIYTPYQANKSFFSATANPSGETPASLACVYGFTSYVAGCPINGTTALPTGGAGVIAIVDAYDNPNAETDLNIFSTQFGLPACTTGNGCFSQVYASGSQPPFDPDWAVEESLDIEWAHAMAPYAKIILVEADSSDNNDLFTAEDVASGLVSSAGGGFVSNSWGGSEYPEEAAEDVHFQTPGVVYLASSGDYAAPATYPSSSPYVISAGGTSVIRQNGLFVEETAWSYNPQYGWGGSGGPSLYESRPGYQNSVSKIVGTQRGTPDISFDANPETGVSVYSTSEGGWIVVGGTSVSSPSLAGALHVAGRHYHSTNDALLSIYGQAIKNYRLYWHDILKGSNGYMSLAGYDFTSGLGSPLGYQGK